jgi:hypothetical protein
MFYGLPAPYICQVHLFRSKVEPTDQEPTFAQRLFIRTRPPKRTAHTCRLLCMPRAKISNHTYGNHKDMDVDISALWSELKRLLVIHKASQQREEFSWP